MSLMVTTDLGEFFIFLLIARRDFMDSLICGHFVLIGNTHKKIQDKTTNILT